MCLFSKVKSTILFVHLSIFLSHSSYSIPKKRIIYCRKFIDHTKSTHVMIHFKVIFKDSVISVKKKKIDNIATGVNSSIKLTTRMLGNLDTYIPSVTRFIRSTNPKIVPQCVHHQRIDLFERNNSHGTLQTVQSYLGLSIQLSSVITIRWANALEFNGKLFPGALFSNARQPCFPARFQLSREP